MDSLRPASGLQIAFFIFSLTIIAIPPARLLMRELGPDWSEREVVRLIIFGMAAAIIVAFRALRKSAWRMLHQPIPRDRRWEFALVTVLGAVSSFAVVGGFVAFDLITHDFVSVKNRRSEEAELAWAFSRSGVLLLIAGSLAAPIIEELVFRGFLFSAWERRWGWLWSAVLTSATFALFHPNFIASFVDSVIFICVLRRTGTLVAPVIVHATHNMVLWYPLLGQFLIPRTNANDPLTWAPHFAALAIALVVLPLYVLAARKAYPSTHLPGNKARTSA